MPVKTKTKSHNGGYEVPEQEPAPTHPEQPLPRSEFK